jgi:hypothetical protein
VFMADPQHIESDNLRLSGMRGRNGTRSPLDRCPVRLGWRHQN